MTYFLFMASCVLAAVLWGKHESAKQARLVDEFRAEYAAIQDVWNGLCAARRGLWSDTERDTASDLHTTQLRSLERRYRGRINMAHAINNWYNTDGNRVYL